MSNLKTAFEIKRNLVNAILFTSLFWILVVASIEYRNSKKLTEAADAGLQASELSFKLGVECGTAALELKNPKTPQELLTEAKRLRDSL